MKKGCIITLCIASVCIASVLTIALGIAFYSMLRLFNPTPEEQVYVQDCYLQDDKLYLLSSDSLYNISGAQFKLGDVISESCPWVGFNGDHTTYITVRLLEKPNIKMLDDLIDSQNHGNGKWSIDDKYYKFESTLLNGHSINITYRVDTDSLLLEYSAM